MSFRMRMRMRPVFGDVFVFVFVAVSVSLSGTDSVRFLCHLINIFRQVIYCISFWTSLARPAAFLCRMLRSRCVCVCVWTFALCLVTFLWHCPPYGIDFYLVFFLDKIILFSHFYDEGPQGDRAINGSSSAVAHCLLGPLMCS